MHGVLVGFDFSFFFLVSMRNNRIFLRFDPECPLAGDLLARVPPRRHPLPLLDPGSLLEVL